MNNSLKISLLAISAVASRFAVADATIETYSGWNGSDFISAFGNPYTDTFGQSFTAPTDSLLTSYKTSFKPLRGRQFEFKFFISEWTGSTLTGPALFESSSQFSLVSDPNSGDPFVQYSFAPNLLLTPGKSYIAYTTTRGIANNPPGLMSQAFSYNDLYSGGGFFFQNSFDGALSDNWNNGYRDGDTAFEAKFSGSGTQAVPEPFTMGLLGMGALVARKRMKKS